MENARAVDALPFRPTAAGSGAGVHVVLLPQMWALDATTQHLAGTLLARIPSPPSASSVSGGAGVARAAMLAAVGSQLLTSALREEKESVGAGEDDLAKALAAGDLSVLLDVLGGLPRTPSQNLNKPFVLTSTSLDQPVVDVVMSVREALAHSPGFRSKAPIPLFLLAVCPTKARWLSSPADLRHQASGIHFAPFMHPQQQVDHLLCLLTGLERPVAPVPQFMTQSTQDDVNPAQDLRRRKRLRSSSSPTTLTTRQHASHAEATPQGTDNEEDLRVPLSFSAIQLVQSLAQLAPDGQTLPRAVAVLRMIFQNHFTSDPLTAFFPSPKGNQEKACSTWTPDGYVVALSRCTVSQNALQPEDSAPPALQAVHEAEYQQLVYAGQRLLPFAASKGESKNVHAHQAHRNDATMDYQRERELGESALLLYLSHVSSLLYPLLAARVWSAKILAGLLDVLNKSTDSEQQPAHDLGYDLPHPEDGIPNSLTGKPNHALRILLASLGPSSRSLEPFLLKAKSGIMSSSVTTVQSALETLRHQASQAVDQLSHPHTTATHQDHGPCLTSTSESSDMDRLRSSTGTLPVAHTLQSVAQGEVLLSLIRSLDPFVDVDGRPLEGDKVIRQDRALTKVAHWVWDCFL